MSRELERRQKRAHDTLRVLAQAVSHSNTDVETHLGQIKGEYTRVTELSRQAEQTINDIDQEFRARTKLIGFDYAFLFLCTALQCARQYLLPQLPRLTAQQGDRLMQNTVGRVVPKAWNDILFASVPYDALNMAVPLDTGLSGTTHRYRTLGHDPILGWIFGTSNILTDGLTKSDVITTYQVMDNTLVGLYPGGTPGMFASAFKTIQADPLNLPAALARQAIHFGSDYFTKQGLPIPFLGTLSPQMAHQFMNSNLKNSVHIDLYGLTTSTLLAAVVNQIIFYLHKLFYNEQRDGSRSAYEIRTRKILTYSNLISTGSNAIAVAITGAVSKLDVGGILVTLCRIASDYRFISQIEREFLEQGFYRCVVGDSYDFMRGNV